MSTSRLHAKKTLARAFCGRIFVNLWDSPRIFSQYLTNKNLFLNGLFVPKPLHPQKLTGQEIQWTSHDQEKNPLKTAYFMAFLANPKDSCEFQSNGRKYRFLLNFMNRHKSNKIE
jgi:hypothetical protein